VHVCVCVCVCLRTVYVRLIRDDSSAVCVRVCVCVCLHTCAFDRNSIDSSAAGLACAYPKCEHALRLVRDACRLSDENRSALGKLGGIPLIVQHSVKEGVKFKDLAVETLDILCTSQVCMCACIYKGGYACVHTSVKVDLYVCMYAKCGIKVFMSLRERYVLK
jgi:hypothetical protein